MQVCALICQTFTFDSGKIFLENKLHPPKVANSLILKKLREPPRQLPYSAVNKCAVNKCAGKKCTIPLEQDLHPPKVANSSILKKLRETPRQLFYSAVIKTMCVSAFAVKKQYALSICG